MPHIFEREWPVVRESKCCIECLASGRKWRQKKSLFTIDEEGRIWIDLRRIGDSVMREPREISVSINERFFTIDLPVQDETLVASVLLGLGQYVKRGLPIKVKQSYITFSGSQEVSTMVISSTQQIAKWGKVTKGVISALLKRQ